MTTNVYFWAADHAGCATYRCRWPAEMLNEMFGDEIEARYGTLMKPEDREWADVVIGQRLVLPGPSMFWDQWYRDGSKYLITEFDDDLFSVDPDNIQASRVFNKSDVQQRLRANIMKSSAVTVSTEPLKDAIHRETGFPLDKIFVIPNAVDPGLLEDPLDRSQMDGAASLGWLASPTHEKDAKLVARHVKRFMETHPDASFQSIGADYGKILGVPDERHEYSGWVSPPERAIRKMNYRIGIAPLQGSTFNKSKSDCKFLEMGARKVAPLVSATPSYSSVTHGVTGYAVRYEHDWGKALRNLHNDTAMQDALAENAYEYVRDNRTTRSTAALWREVILNQEASS